MPESATKHFNLFIEVGRLCYINRGPLESKLVVVVDIIDQNRVLIDSTGCVERQEFNMKHINLTKIVLPGVTGTTKRDELIKIFKVSFFLKS